MFYHTRAVHAARMFLYGFSYIFSRIDYAILKPLQRGDRLWNLFKLNQHKINGINLH